MDTARDPFGRLLRQWRTQRRWSQLELAGEAAVSTRHLSWLENGRAQPSRAMVLRLAERLDVPLRERNAWLAAAGFAPLYRDRTLDDPALRPALRTLQRVLDAHEPWPALAVDAHWNLVALNRAVAPLLDGVADALLRPPVNVLRLALHPDGLARRTVGFAAWREHLLARLRRQATAADDAPLQRLLEEVDAWPLPTPARAVGAAAAAAAADEIADDTGDYAMSVAIDTPRHGRWRFITTVTVFGMPHDVAVAGIAIETLLPADAATAASLQQLHAARGDRAATAAASPGAGPAAGAGSGAVTGGGARR